MGTVGQGPPDETPVGAGAGAGPSGRSDAPGAASASAAARPALPGPELAARTGLRRLTVYEYDNTLRDLLGDDSRGSRLLLPDDPRTLFDNDYTNQVGSKALVEGVELLATDAAARLLKDAPRRDRVVGCKPTGPGDEACLRAFVTSFGRRALRRPLGDDEVTRFVALRALADRAGDFYVAVQAVVEAFLQHPEFLYRVEIGAPVPSRPGLLALGPYELASRLSYLIWGSMPDDRLLDRAAARGLGSSDGVRAAAVAMLADARARAHVARFHALWLGYEEMKVDPTLAAAMQAETAALIGRVVFDEHRPWQDLLRIDETFVPDLLAKQYGLAPTGSKDPRWVKYGDSGRRGLLSHGTFLSIGAKATDTSPTLRGKLIRERLFCQDVPPPPPNVNTDGVTAAASGSLCKADRYAIHDQGGCAGCHSLMDPIGFGLENYDQSGRYRTAQYWIRDMKDPKNPVVALATATTPGAQKCDIQGSGEVVGTGAFKGPAELGDLVLRSGRLDVCATTQLYRFAVGRTELFDADQAPIDALAARLGRGDFRLDELVADFVAAPAFAHRREDQ
jgi:hypothetical protein